MRGEWPQIELAEGHRYSSPSIQALLRHLRDRKRRENIVYPVMEFTVVTVRGGSDVACLRFCVRHGVLNMFHSHNITLANWPSRIAGIKNFVGDIKQNGVFVDRIDMESTLEMLCGVYPEDSQDELRSSMFFLDELELAILKMIAPLYTQHWGELNAENHIERSFENAYGNWLQDTLPCVCFEDLMWNNIARIWHFLKMVQMSSNILQDRAHRPGTHTFGVYLALDGFKQKLFN
ncbi:hypothetical protein L596_028777 [Steinernema carpocapsae]|uniref:Uncharacterized protein n=1 Tax=Steinernema carpocapsae TaxID=34508 RepID=A0A4U5LZE9_STECR|nr:hypothetical protein L596_028777 [Steinernema carpocapsae]